MNDLAERALHGLDVVRSEVSSRPAVPVAAAGFLVAAVVTVTGGRIGAAPSALPIDRWLGLLPGNGYRVVGNLLGAAMLAGIVALVGLWLLLLALLQRGAVGERAAWTVAAVWSLPFLIGPPLLSTDVYSYVAHGQLFRAGLSPYHHGPSALGMRSIVGAIDPDLRSSRSVVGPLGALIEHLLASVVPNSPVVGVLLMRAITVVSVVIGSRLAATLAARQVPPSPPPPEQPPSTRLVGNPQAVATRRAQAIGMTAANPAVLLFLVSAAHLSAVMIALLLAAIVAATTLRWTRAVVFAGLAAGVAPIALLALPAVLAMHAAGHRRRVVLRIVARDLLMALATLTVCVLVTAHGLDWARNLDTVTRDHTPIAASSVLSDVVSWIVPAASFDDLSVGGRIAAGVAGLTVAGYLLATVRSRPLERTVGFTMLAAGLLGPVMYPWTLLWGIGCLAGTATDERRDWVIALSAAACVLAPAGFSPHATTYVATAALVLIGLVTAARITVRYRAEQARAATAAEV